MKRLEYDVKYQLSKISVTIKVIRHADRTKSMSPTITIETPRLLIRPPKLSDAKPLNDAIQASLPTLQRWMPWASDPSFNATEQFIQKAISEWSRVHQKIFPMIILLKSTSEMIGGSGFNEMSNPQVPYFDIGYWIHSNYTGQGYISECVNALTQFAFDKLHAVRVQIRAQRENIKSIAVAKRCGFEEEALLKKVFRDCQTGLACDDFMFACFDKAQLPDLLPIKYLST